MDDWKLSKCVLCFLGQPYGEIQCSANSSHHNEHVMLSCSWEGGFPQALLWWASSSGEMQGTSKESTNVLVLNSSASFNGKIFVCNAKHPLIKESKQCVIKLGKTCSEHIKLTLRFTPGLFWNMPLSFRDTSVKDSAQYGFSVWGQWYPAQLYFEQELPTNHRDHLV